MDAPPGQAPRYHVHHSYIWLSSAQAAGSIVLIGALSVALSALEGLLGGSGEVVLLSMVEALVVVGACLAALLVTAGWSWLSWRNLYYQLGEDGFTLCSGVVNKKRAHVPYGRIQSVEQRATLVQRLLGVCSVAIDTAGGPANKALVVPYVRTAQAEDLRRRLHAQKQRAQGMPEPAAAPPAQAATEGNVLDAAAGAWDGVRGVFGGRAVDTGPARYEYGLTNKELVFAGLTNNTAFPAVVVGVLGAAAQAVNMLTLPLADLPSDVVGRAAELGLSLFGANVITFLLLAVVLTAAAAWGLSAVGTCLAYGGFRARRTGNRIEVERGLLQHRVQGVDVDRVQFVRVRQGLIPRLLGCCELSVGKVDAVDGEGGLRGDADRHNVVIHPFVRMERVPEVLAGMLPEFAGVPTAAAAPAPRALRRALIRRCVLHGSGFWLAVALAAVQVTSTLLLDRSDLWEGYLLSYVTSAVTAGYVVSVALFALNVVDAVLWYRESGFSCNRDFMQVSNGGLSRESVGVPRRKLQFARVSTNPFQRRARTATLHAHTAAGVGGTAISLVDVREEDAEAWLGWARPRRNVVE